MVGPKPAPYKNTNDEMFGMFFKNKLPREHCKSYWSWFLKQSSGDLRSANAEAELLFKKFGITFTMHATDHTSEETEIDRTIPFDLIPRILSKKEWGFLERGLLQRTLALNNFIADVYGKGKIFSNGDIPAELIFKNSQFRFQMHGITLPDGIYAHVSGTDLVRTKEDNFFVLEDNLRVPSGVSYMIENRKVMMRLFPEVFETNKVSPIEHYPDLLLKHLKSMAKTFSDDPNVVLLTPGIFNSAYFEHAYLAQQMGIELVEGRDLFVENERVFMKTTAGSIRVDVIYRRIDDDFIDPLFFRPDSVLGVPGLLAVIRSGGVVLCNAVGTGIADDKSVYPYVPEMIKFYLGEEPLLNNVKTYLCRNKRHKSYVLKNLNKLVVKEVHGAGGVGMLVGPLANKNEIAKYKARIETSPDKFIAQPMLALSTNPTYVNQEIVPRHVDLRPFVLHGPNPVVVPGGLTRVALREGSVVVNSSQGGGTKDTWVIW